MVSSMTKYVTLSELKIKNIFKYYTKYDKIYAYGIIYNWFSVNIYDFVIRANERLQ
jgi:hypothetical protein